MEGVDSYIPVRCIIPMWPLVFTSVYAAAGSGQAEWSALRGSARNASLRTGANPSGKA